MALPSRPFRSRRRSRSFSEAFFAGRTCQTRFRRSNPVTSTAGSRSPSWRTMSVRTSGVAVAVRAATGGFPSASRTAPSRRYEGRKSCPHSETQCASSTARSETWSSARRRWNPSASKRSGATYRRRTSPRPAASSRAAISAEPSVEFTKVAGTPAASSASTWSFISEMSGETTRVTPGRSMAGTWKHRLLPPPVGMMVSESPPDRTLRTAWSWPGRKSGYPQ